jgi:hypothetical protein
MSKDSTLQNQDSIEFDEGTDFDGAPAGMEPTGDGPVVGDSANDDAQEHTGQVDEGDSAPPKLEDGKDIDSVQKAINKQHYKFQEERRRAEAEKARADALEQKLRQQQPMRRPVVPPMPDAFDSEFEQKMKFREKAIGDQKAFDIQMEMQQRMQQQRQQDMATKQQQKVQESVQKFQERATALKIDPQQMIEHENVVGTYIQDPQIANFLLADKQGPLLVKYLAENPMELMEISALDTVNAVAKIARDVLPKVTSAPSSISRTPAPSKEVSGRGAADTKDPALDGLVLE